MRTHNIGARGTLHAPEETASILTCVTEVLRQTTLQVHQRDVRKPAPGTAANASTQLNTHK